MLLGTWEQPKISTLISLIILMSCQVSFKNVTVHKLGREHSNLENHSELHPQETQGCTALSKWKFADQSCKDSGNTQSTCVLQTHRDICLYTYLRACMYTHRHVSIKYREAPMYTTYLAGKGSTKASCPTATSRSSAGLQRHIFTNLPQEY